MFLQMGKLSVSITVFILFTVNEAMTALLSNNTSKMF